jgi:hypothetical protein
MQFICHFSAYWQDPPVIHPCYFGISGLEKCICKLGDFPVCTHLWIAHKIFKYIIIVVINKTSHCDGALQTHSSFWVCPGIFSSDRFPASHTRWTTCPLLLSLRIEVKFSPCDPALIHTAYPGSPPVGYLDASHSKRLAANLETFPPQASYLNATLAQRLETSVPHSIPLPKHSVDYQVPFLPLTLFPSSSPRLLPGLGPYELSST